MEHFDGARLSPNSVRNAVWQALNEPVCQYLQTRNPRSLTVYIDNSLGPLARDSPCITQYIAGPFYCTSSYVVKFLMHLYSLFVANLQIFQQMINMRFCFCFSFLSPCII